MGGDGAMDSVEPGRWNGECWFQDGCPRCLTVLHKLEGHMQMQMLTLVRSLCRSSILTVSTADYTRSVTAVAT